MKKVLIIEDDQWLAENYQMVLEKNGWQVTTTAYATKAIDIIDIFQPDALLLDFILPDKNAPTLLNELQSHTDTASVPVALCTSFPSEQLDKSTLKYYGIQAIIDKTTITPDELLKKMNSLFANAAT